MNIAILIVNWNGFDDTKICLTSIAKHCKEADVLLLENGSGEEERLRSILGDRTELFVSEKNLGFGGGCNLLIKESMNRGYDFVFLLNNDAEVTDGFLDEPLDLMNDPSVGFVNSKLILKDSGKIDTAGHWHLNSGDVIPAGRGRPASEFSENRIILSGCAAALLLRVSMLDEIGVFREEFFLGYEDVDLTYRASVMGWKGIYCAGSVVLHSLNASIKKIRDREFYVRSQRNSLLAYLYNTPKGVMLMNFLWIVLKFLVFAIYCLFTKQRPFILINVEAVGVAFSKYRISDSIVACSLASSFRTWWRQRNFLIGCFINRKSLTNHSRLCADDLCSNRPKDSQ